MTATSSAFALVGRSFPSESFEALYQSSVAMRDRRRDLWSEAGPPSRRSAWLAARRAPVFPSRAS